MTLLQTPVILSIVINLLFTHHSCNHRVRLGFTFENRCRRRSCQYSTRHASCVRHVTRDILALVRGKVRGFCSLSSLSLHVVSIAMINIMLNHQPQVPFLTISRNEVERLSNSHFRWIRYVMFTICGARGNISMTPDGHPVNYDDTLLEYDTNLYYTPSGKFPSILEAHLAHILAHIRIFQEIVTLWTTRR